MFVIYILQYQVNMLNYNQEKEVRTDLLIVKNIFMKEEYL